MTESPNAPLCLLQGMKRSPTPLQPGALILAALGTDVIWQRSPPADRSINALRAYSSVRPSGADSDF
jgi:hypothetical protein